jgi:hypothetical protein
MQCAVDYWSRQNTSPENPGLAIRLMAEWMEEWVFRGVEKK